MTTIAGKPFTQLENLNLLDELRIKGIPVGEGAANVVIVNSADDFPAAVGGVRELVPFSGAEITYLLGAVDIDVGSDVFTCTDGDIVIRGTHRTASGITTSSSGTMFTCEDSAFFTEFVGFTCPNAKWLAFTNPGAGIKSLVSQNGIIRDCDTLGTIDGAFVTSFRTFTVVDTQTGGFTWTGTTNGQINMSATLALGWTGILFDLGTATLSLIDIGPGCRFISASGTTILSGATGSANLTASGRALVDGNIFNGTGTALAGITTEDLQWSFTGNVFADNTTRNTLVAANSFLTSARTVTITSSGVFVAINGTDWSSPLSARFTASTGGLLTYIGLETITVNMAAHSTVEKSGGGTDEIATKIAKNGTVMDSTIGATENSTPTGVASTGITTLETDDTLQLFAANMDTTGNIIVDESTFIVTLL